MDQEPGRQFLRHTVATLAYRGGKALRGAPPAFSTFSAGTTTRTPGQILAHLGDLLDWALSQAEGKQRWSDSTPQAWDEDVQRFFRALEALDAYLASNGPLGYPPEAIFQGAIADALTHVGQINMLRRLAGAPVRGENYFKADIVPGRVGAEQTAARLEFD
jgi:hypothetical protein